MLIRCLSLSLVERSIGVYSAGNKQQQCFEVCILIYIYIACCESFCCCGLWHNRYCMLCLGEALLLLSCNFNFRPFQNLQNNWKFTVAKLRYFQTTPTHASSCTKTQHFLSKSVQSISYCILPQKRCQRSHPVAVTSSH